MSKIGDVVSYKDFIAVITAMEPLTLALNTGETCTCSTADITPLVSSEQVITMFVSAL